MAKKSETLSSVERALSLLEILGREEALNLTQLADRLRANKTTVLRLAMTLAEHGWVEKDADLCYSLGPAALGLGALHGGGAIDVKRLLLPVMMELHEETQETIHLTRLEGRFIIYLHQLLSPKPVVSLATMGTRSPAHCVSPGLALLATLSESRLDWFLNRPLTRYTDLSMTSPDAVRREIEQVRKRGYGVNFGSYRPDVGGVGVAIFDQLGKPIAGLSVCVPVFRLNRLDIDTLGQRLRRAASDARFILSEAVGLPSKENHK